MKGIPKGNKTAGQYCDLNCWWDKCPLAGYKMWGFVEQATHFAAFLWSVLQKIFSDAWSNHSANQLISELQVKSQQNVIGCLVDSERDFQSTLCLRQILFFLEREKRQEIGHYNTCRIKHKWKGEFSISFPTFKQKHTNVRKNYICRLDFLKIHSLLLNKTY